MEEPSVIVAKVKEFIQKEKIGESDIPSSEKIDEGSLI